MIRITDLTTPYKEAEYGGISYSTCRDFAHISRYRTLRQVVHSPDTNDRYVTLETPNAFISNADIVYHEVSSLEENRLDLIANEYLGSPTYSWVIAYFNNIEDGYTALEGQKLKIPKSITALLNAGEVLAPVSALKLNLGEE